MNMLGKLVNQPDERESVNAVLEDIRGLWLTGSERRPAPCDEAGGADEGVEQADDAHIYTWRS